ncbi:MAG: hypothetical protein AMXMBFR7_26810 [Planctomycetota bacterium]
MFSAFVEKILGRRNADDVAARAAVAELAAAEAAGNADSGTLANLEKRLAGLQISRDEFREQVELHRKRARLKASAATAPALAKKADEAAFNADATVWKERETTHRLRAEVQAAELAAQNARSLANAAERDARELAALEYQNAEAFGLPRRDLDSCSLRHGENYLAHGDDDAPVQDVPADVFHRELLRRRDLLDAAQKEAYVAHQRAWEIYAAAITRPGDPSMLESDAHEAEWKAAVARRAKAAGVVRPPMQAPRLTWADVVKASK